MNTSETPTAILARLRLVTALDLAERCKIRRLCGAKLGPGLAAILGSPAVLQGFYGLHLRRMADSIFAGCPQIEELLVQDDWEEMVLGPLIGFANAEIDRWLSPGQLAEFHSSLEALADKLSESLESITGDGRSPLEADQETLAQEPWRLYEAFPLKALGLDSREVSQLADTLGASFLGLADRERMDDYAQVLWPHLLQLATDLLAIELPRLRKSFQIWDLLGLEPGSIAPNATTDELAEVVVPLFTAFSQQEQRLKLARWVLGRILRQEYGLSQGRKVRPVSSLSNEDYSDYDPFEQQSFADPKAEKDFAAAEDRMVLEDLWALASPAQREALEVYAQAEVSGKSVAEVSRGLGRDPNVVRNNFQAFRRKVRSRPVDS